MTGTKTEQIVAHASLETTTIYTQVSIRKLQEIHAATHPVRSLRGRAAVVKPRTKSPQRPPKPS